MRPKGRFVKVAGGKLFVRAAGSRRSRLSLLLIHGLGDSGLSFMEAFQYAELLGARLVVPDLLGYGRSMAAKGCDYGLEAHVARLWELIDHLELDRICLVGHSMGGDLGTLMASDDPATRIAAFINVEGNLTPHDRFISTEARRANDENNFPYWFSEKFREKLVWENWGRKWLSCRRYYASLWLARPEAFLVDALDLFAKNEPVAGQAESMMGLSFAKLSIPKSFCWGTKSLSSETQEYLRDVRFPRPSFKNVFHWLMIDAAVGFYGLVGGVVKELATAS